MARKTLILDPRRILGRMVLKWATQVGRITYFSVELCRGLRHYKQWFHPAIQQAQDIGYGSLFIVLITASFAGAVTALQAGYQLWPAPSGSRPWRCRSFVSIVAARSAPR